MRAFRAAALLAAALWVRLDAAIPMEWRGGESAAVIRRDGYCLPGRIRFVRGG